ncbi:hypothetical protein EBR96_07755 [bacterium]|nr:hypothetical protein [bacterium]
MISTSSLSSWFQGLFLPRNVCFGLAARFLVDESPIFPLSDSDRNRIIELQDAHELSSRQNRVLLSEYQKKFGIRMLQRWDSETPMNQPAILVCIRNAIDQLDRWRKSQSGSQLRIMVSIPTRDGVDKYKHVFAIRGVPKQSRYEFTDTVFDATIDKSVSKLHVESFETLCNELETHILYLVSKMPGKLVKLSLYRFELEGAVSGGG